MARYLTLVDARTEKLDGWSIWRVPQEKNKRANTLVEVATTLPIQETTVLAIYLQITPSIFPKQVNDIV